MPVKNYPEMPESAPATYCQRCGQLYEFSHFTRLGYASFRCTPCKVRESVYVGRKEALEWLKENK